MEDSVKKVFDYQEIETFEKVLQFKGETLEQFNDRTYGMDVDTAGYEKVKAIAFAMNGGKHVTEGYYPWFYNPTRSYDSLSLHGSFLDNDAANVGSRHLMIDRERAIFAGKTFPREYSQFINGTEE